MSKLKVAVLFGGQSGEHDVSLVSARSVVSALDKNKYDVQLVGITKQGQWISGDNSFDLLESIKDNNLIPSLASKNMDVANVKAGAGLYPAPHIPAEKVRSRVQPYSCAPSLIPSLAENEAKKFDVVIPVLHGPYGEDGTVQGLLEIAGLPYVGSGVLGSAMGMDKIAMKMIFQANNLPICGYIWFLRPDWKKNKNRIIKDIEKRLGYPCFIKPANLGSSVGISKAHNKKELIKAVNLAVKYDRRVIVEEGVNCREVECAVLGNDRPQASTVAEIIPDKEFYDYEAKYTEGLSQVHIPAKLPKTVVKKLQDLSKKAFIALDLAGMARVDFFVRKENNEVLINEVNTIPGFTSTSMFPKLWEASGIKYPKLLDTLIRLALERYKCRGK